MLTQAEFQKKLGQNTLRLCFIGMSNIGKSHMSQLLKDAFGFNIYEVDEEIQRSMALSDIGSSANWMGYPFEARYPDNVQTYLDLESQKTLEAPLTNHNLALDTTGSVINLAPTLHQWLQANFLVVNFDCADSMLEAMSKNYFKHPKPVVWGESFNQHKNEDGIDALKRCYPQLLADRTKLYRELADVTIPGEVTRSLGVTAQRLVDLISLNLPTT